MIKKEFILFFLLIACFYLLRSGYMYLQHEEPRRAIVALEMNQSKNYFQPTVLGKAYFKKPPLHNIAIALSYKIFGKNAFAVRFPSILCALLIAFFVFLFTKNILYEKSYIACLSFLTCFEVFFLYGIWGETDLFFSLFAFLSMISLFSFKKKGILLGLIFCSLAFLSKGFAALIFFYLTFIAYSLYKKRLISHFFSIHHLLGILVFLGLTGFWLLHTSNAHASIYALWGEVFSRSPLQFSILKFLKHIFLFPFKCFIQTLPWSIFLLFLFNKKVRTRIKEISGRQKELLIFCLIVLGVNFIPYEISPEGRIRYLIPLLPFLSIFIAPIVSDLNEKEFKYANYMWVIVCILVIAAFFSDIFMLKNLTDGILLLVLSIAVFSIPKRTLFPSILCAMLILKVIHSYCYVPFVRAHYPNYKEMGEAIARNIKNYDKHKKIESNDRFLKLMFYIEKDLPKMITPLSCKNSLIITRDVKAAKKGNIVYSLSTPHGIYYISSFK